MLGLIRPKIYLPYDLKTEERKYILLHEQTHIKRKDHIATKKHILNGSPLAFGEGRVKGRIKNVLNYKKPRFWVVIVFIIIVTAVGLGLMAPKHIYL